ncbi:MULTISPECIES: long-chain fatty acid--CoA ligase [Caballeronia]|uniref:Long-chain fatty acid--CoA ligase n=1 Tax=Caballeronia zhejiangensis TaxID=871203 RepID=A0A656Q9W0_9BURK|nr:MULTISPECIES: long-chain fatty acid--CoA ligase [Caballeronia]EKS71825.1 medium-chain-fatty-acid--CoA ligase [Burkholderia sp. SJ98]KAK44019.1 long-chain fatty acid--CoA ligase [Caballeronia jiangsuensis]KDR25333.1 long-chain fatty acid--CoA ligase [Caballeronia zhejiangensis]
MSGVPIEEQLLLPRLLSYASRCHGEIEVVARDTSGEICRQTYAQTELRARRLASSLIARGYGHGTKLAVLAWNTIRYFELFYSVPGIGAALHTVNPRLFIDQIDYIINDACDSVLFFDGATLPIVEQIAERLTNVKTFVAMGARGEFAEAKIPNVVLYEELVEEGDASYEWPEFDEKSAAVICYTSGTTGAPKGVTYTHRSLMLSSLIGSANMPGSPHGERQVLLSLAPMFHANAWNFPFMGPLTGSKVVFPGRDMRPESLYELIEAEAVTGAAGVPSIWRIIVDWLDCNGKRFSTMRQAFSAGSPLPTDLMKALTERYGLDVSQSWGMTEAPNASSGALKPEHNKLPSDAKLTYREKAGREIFGMRLRIVDDQGHELARDGRAVGHLRVRGLWTPHTYINYPDRAALDADGWLVTGDVATIDSDGYVQIVDRAKDVIKSGGEWISSVELERIAMLHPDVERAAVIAVDDERWGERPMLIVTLHAAAKADAQQIIEFMRPRIARWWAPDTVKIVDAIPTTATGKINKVALRKRFT